MEAADEFISYQKIGFAFFSCLLSCSNEGGSYVIAKEIGGERFPCPNNEYRVYVIRI